YQWQKDGTDISGATGNQYTISSTVMADAGTYRCLARNSAGSTASDGAELTVTMAPPVITTPVVSKTVVEGGPAAFSLVAEGLALRYYWQKRIDGLWTDIPNTPVDQDFYTIASTVLSDAGEYRCVVSNDGGSVYSNFTLTVTAAAVAPFIISQPAPQAVLERQSAVFSVSAGGSEPLTYQWRRNGAAITGASSPGYTAPEAVLADNGTEFDVVISNGLGSVTSQTAVMTVSLAPPEITVHPSPQTVDEGGPAVFSVTAIGTGVTYQWQKDGTNIPGATGTQHTISAATMPDEGAYRCVAGNAAGNDTSNGAGLNVLPLSPVIITHPVSQTVYEGDPVTFTVLASGFDLSYRWERWINNRWRNIGGGNEANYTISSTVLDDTMDYRCVVSNEGGTASTSPATLTVLEIPLPPVITVHPAGQAVTEGQTAGFSVTASSTAPLTYQWRRDGAPIAGATSAGYTTPVTVLADNGAEFDVVVANRGGSVTSSAAVLTVDPALPVITVQPAGQVVTEGQTASFGVTATSSVAMTYQWRKNGTPIAGATSAGYTTPASTLPDNGAQYDVVVTNSSGSVTSNAAMLTVNPLPPVITVPPANQSVTVGQTASFSVSVTSIAPVTYQWRKNGTPIAGAVLAGYTTPATVLADNGAQFDVVVSNTGGGTTSTVAILTVTE
ncbi:immunoglobulin domain-containing protein, partial [Fibrobacterota bacterium]